MRNSVENIIETNISEAIDQSGAFDFQETGKCEWFEGDSYSQNVYDTCLEEGYTEDEAADASNGFRVEARRTEIRFA